MSERMYTWHHLCDTCDNWKSWKPNYTGLDGRCLVTEKSGVLFHKRAINNRQQPSEVCKVYKPRRDMI